MAKAVIPYEEFLVTVPADQREFVDDTHQWLTEAGFMLKIAEAKNGFVVSYHHPASKHVLMNYIFRKKGIIARIYADEVVSYMAFLQTLPDEMRADFAKSANCRRMLAPDACNPRCKMGYDYLMDGTRLQKCRINAFMIHITQSSAPFVRGFLEQEVAARG